MTNNQACWLPAKGAALEVGSAPTPQAGAGQIVVRAHAVAINPIDWVLQRLRGLGFSWLRYPLVLGWDVAGEVVAVGRGVTRFTPGDRVVGFAVGLDKAVNDPSEGAFQHYVRLREAMTTPIPPTLGWAEAAVLPLGAATAACALFQKGHLALDHPTAAPHKTEQTLLVWGGSTSVGSNAIQLAAAAGYEVFTTASPRNHDYVRSLGATRTFDYRSPGVVPEIVAAMQGRTLAGVVAIGARSATPCVSIAGACTGRRVVAMTSPPVSFDQAPLGRGRLAYLLRTMPRLVAGTMATMLLARRRGVRAGFVNGVTLLHDEVGPMLFASFLPQALCAGTYRAVPEPLVTGTGLAAISDALDRQRHGVSARKVVVLL